MFDKQKLYENIKTLSKVYGVNLGEIEEEAGVSKGYLSRIVKEKDGSVPLLDVIFVVTQQFKISIDSLFFHDFPSMEKDEHYIYRFINKLLVMSYLGQIKWENNAQKDLFSNEKVKPESGFCVKYDDSITFYICRFQNGDDLVPSYSLFVKNRDSFDKICKANTPESVFFYFLNELFELADVSCELRKVSEPARSAIDKFMTDNQEVNDNALVYKKYKPLNVYLSQQNTDQVVLQFSQMEEILNFELPPNAYKFRQFWGNTKTADHPHAKAWLEAGYKTVNVSKTLRDQYIIFEKSK